MAGKNAPALTVTLDTARAFWHARQGLAAPAAQDPTAAVAATGWARTLGGVDVYLAIRARCPAVSRAAVDAAVASGVLCVVPAVRGCIYLVPRADVPLLMALAADIHRPRTERELDKVGVAWSEVEGLMAEVRSVLARGPLRTAEIRKALPDGAARSLGAVGKAVGLSSPLPVALRELEFRGKIERMPVGGRLDTERYEWKLAAEAGSGTVPGDATRRLAAVLERVLRFFGPVSLKELTAWVGASQRDAKQALVTLPVASVRIEDRGDAFVLESDLEALREAASGSQAVTFLPFEDNLLTVHGGPAVFTDPVHHGRKVLTWGNSKGSTLGDARHLGQRTLFLGERLVGFWEWDAEAGEIMAAPFEPLAEAHRKTLDASRERLRSFVLEELGHARSFSLDTDDAVRARAAALSAKSKG